MYTPDTPAVRALHDAVWRNDVTAAQKAFENGADPNATAPFFDPADEEAAHEQTGAPEALLFQIRNGSDERKQAIALFRLFLAYGVSLKTKDRQAQTPLFTALFLEDADLIKDVVAQGADAHATFVEPFSGNENSVNAVNLLVSGTTSNNEKENLPLLLFFLEKGVDPNRHGTDSMTPLQYAAFMGLPRVAAALIARGADVRATMQSGSRTGMPVPGSPAGHTAIELAAYRGNPDVLRILSEATPNLSAAEAAATGATDALAGLITSGKARPNDTGLENTPLLVLAIRSGAAQTVRLLLAHGASPEAHDPRGGATALMVAANLELTEMARDLLDHGANPNGQKYVAPGQDRNYKRADTPVEAAIDAPAPSTLALLLERGATIKGPGPLERTVRNAGRLPGVIISQQQRRDFGRGGLEAAQIRVFEQILEKTNVPKYGGSALRFALMRDQPHLAQALRAYGANPNSP